jgi:UTP--glucose-1-phosphate uridylyltransferase
MGRYVLTPAVFECLERTGPGRHGEVQLTDALQHLLEKERIVALEIEGRRYDIGDKLDWLKATVELALKRQEFGDELVSHLGGLLEDMAEKKRAQGTGHEVQGSRADIQGAKRSKKPRER